MGENHLDDAKKAAEVIGTIIQAAGDNPNVKEAGQELGKAALTLAKTVNVVLLPLAAVNFGYDKAKEYFSDKSKFEKEFSEKLKEISAENITEPKPSVAGPALQGLAFCHDEPDLKEMYLNLLSKAMDKKTKENVHPAYVEVVKQLNTDDAIFLRHILKDTKLKPIVAINAIKSKNSYIPLVKNFFNFRDENTGNPLMPDQMPSIIDNWVRLGLIEIDYSGRLTDESHYEWVEKRPDWLKIKEMAQRDNIEISYEKGTVQATWFGRIFAEVVGIKPIFQADN